MGINIVYKTWLRKLLTKFSLNPLDVHITREEASDSIAPRDTQVSGETPLWAHGKFYRHGKLSLIMPCVLSI
jgi:hypothetical protein